MNTSWRRWTVLWLLLCAPWAPLAAEEVVERTLEVRADGEVRVRNVAGSIVVQGWNRSEVRIVARLSGAQELEVDEREGLLLIDVRTPGRRSSNAALELWVPRGTRLQATTVSADLEVEGVEGPLDLQTVSGTVASSGFGSELRARSVSGAMTLEGSERRGRTEVTTVNGAVRLTGVTGSLELSAVDGSVRIDGGRFERVRVNVVSGDVRGQLTLTDDGVLDAESVSGRIAIRLPDDLQARFDLQSFSGRIGDCNGRQAEPQSRFGPGRRLAFTRGEGGATVRGKSMSGELDFCGP